MVQDISYKDFAMGILGIESPKETNTASPDADIPRTGTSIQLAERQVD